MDRMWSDAAVPAQQDDLLIDDRGNEWPACSPELRAHLNYWRRSVDLVGYVLRNLAFVRIRLRRDLCHVTFRAGWVGDDTLGTAILHMAGHACRRYLMETTEPEPQLVLLGNLDDAVALLLCRAGSGDAPPRPAYLASPLHRSRLSDPKLATLRGYHRRWQTARGRLDGFGTLELGLASSAGRTTLLRLTRDTAIFERCSGGYSAFGRAWINGLIGRPLEDVPDAGYGRATFDAYRRVGRTGEPSLQLIEALLHVPGQAPTRLRYERLLLPWESRGERFVSSSSTIRLSIPVGTATPARAAT